MLDVLEANDLYLKLEKCIFKQDKIEYLGVIVGKGRLRMDPKKLKGVANYLVPRNPTNVRAFLGLCGYYHYFIPHFSQITWPLLELTRKTEAWHWNKPQHKAFEKLKSKMCAAPVLKQPNFKKKFYLQTDASAYGIGAILSQEGDTPTTSTLSKCQKPVLHPVTYYSATFIPAEWNYNIYKRELLAVIKALTHWWPYLGWTKEPFTIMTDHANLQYWKSPKNLNHRTACWHMDLQEYDFDSLYILGKTNIPPDVLSRLPGADKGKNDNKEVVVLPPEKFVIATAPTQPKIEVLPLDLVKRGIMRLVHDYSSAGHPGRDETLRKTQERYYWPNMKEWITNYVKGCAICQQNKILTYYTKVPIYHIPMKPNACPFQHVAMDLIIGLPPIRGKDVILTIVDQGCSYVAIFLACDTTIIGPGIMQLYLDHIYRWFGLPIKVISDWDLRFMSHFRKGLAKKLGIQQNLSTAFHP